MENKQEQLTSAIESVLERRLTGLKAEIKKEILDFRRWNPQDSVSDQFSPITGASQQIGFYGTNKKPKQTVTGSKGGNAALTSLLTALATIGLIADSSS